MIDLRSDTVTKPSKEMRKAMYDAEVGDDVYSEDPSINELQEYIANLLGKEDAIFVPSGTMSNQIGIAVNTNTGDEIITESQAHIFYYETSGPSVISRVQIKPINSINGMMPINDIIDAIRPNEYYFPKTSLICLENTHNRHSGSIIELEYIKEVKEIAKIHNIILHCDGARLWNACIAKSISPSKYAEYFDTISVCLSKGLGAPVGSLLCGAKEKIKQAKKFRKILGGGMRQAGVIAAAGLFAIKNNYQLLIHDHDRAKLFANKLLDFDSISLDINKIKTNMVVFSPINNINIDEFLLSCRNSGLLMGKSSKNTIRAVFHFQISQEDTINAINIINNVLNKLK